MGCANDTEEYIATPLPDQQADLRDFDSDGVINARDRCPNTPKGAEVSNDGCEEYYEVAQQQTLKILFQNDSTEVNPVFGSQIEGMAEFLKEYPETSVELQALPVRQVQMSITRNCPATAPSWFKISWLVSVLSPTASES